MRVVDAVIFCAVLAHGAWIVAFARSSHHTGADAAAPSRPRPALLAAALVLVVANLALVWFAAAADAAAARQRHLAFAWLMIVPAVLAISGVAHAVAVLSIPRSARSPRAESFAWLLCLGAFAVTACYGAVLIS